MRKMVLAIMSVVAITGIAITAICISENRII